MSYGFKLTRYEYHESSLSRTCICIAPLIAGVRELRARTFSLGPTSTPVCGSEAPPVGSYVVRLLCKRLVVGFFHGFFPSKTLVDPDWWTPPDPFRPQNGTRPQPLPSSLSTALVDWWDSGGPSLHSPPTQPTARNRGARRDMPPCRAVSALPWVQLVV